MADAVSGNGAERVWGLRGRPVRAARPALTLERIATAAIDLADAEGMAAVAMQQVAAGLDVTKMALYRHVASKAELVAVMVEMAVGEPPDLAAVPGGWRERLTAWALAVRDVWWRHPWLPVVTVGARVQGPREIGWTDAAVGALEGTGLNGRERMDAVLLLGAHVRATQSVETASSQPWTPARGLDPAIGALIIRHGVAFPALRAATADLGEGPLDNGWEFGLARVLDGLALLVEARQAP